jgi:membrane protease subunit HflC
MEVIKMKKITKAIIGGVSGLAALIIGLSSTYVLNEKQQAVVEFQGRPVRTYVGSFEAGRPDEERIQRVRDWADDNGYGYVEVEDTEGMAGTGLHFKIPFFEKVVKFPDQIVEHDADPETLQTNDKKQLTVDNFTKFYIDNPLCYHLRVGNKVDYGIRKIDDIVYSAIRDNLGRHDFIENIRTTNRQVMALDGPITNLETVDYGREHILDDIIRQVDDSASQLGMNIVDIRFINVDLPDANKEAVYDRMIAERNRIADLYTAQGQAESLKITANADSEAAQTRADALEQAGQIIGAGESEAARIYTTASSQDPEFFSFWRTMKAYESAYGVPGNNQLYLTTDSEFNQFLFGPEPQE